MKNAVPLEPLITTIIPTYRRPKLLGRAIRSLLRQTYRGFEIHVWDNASHDETPKIVAELARTDPRIKYHCNSKNIGWLENFRRGMSAVGSPFFHMMGDDDIVFPSLFQSAMNAFERDPIAMMFAGATAVAEVDGTVLDIPIQKWKEGFLAPPAGAFEILQHTHTDLPGMVFRREVLSEVGLFNPAVVIGVDVDYQLRVAIQYPIVVCKELCGVFFQSEGNQQSSNEYEPINFWPGLYIMAETLAGMKNVPEWARMEASNILLTHLKQMLFLRGCKTAVLGRSREAWRIAQILEENFHLRLRSLFVRALSVGGAIGTGKLRERIVREVRRSRLSRKRALAAGDKAVYSKRIDALVCSLN